MSKEEVQARLGNIPCTVSTLIDKYLYCNPESGGEYPKKPVNFTVSEFIQSTTKLIVIFTNDKKEKQKKKKSLTYAMLCINASNL